MIILPASLRIGVIRGGSGEGYDFSLKTGAHVLENLSQTHKPIDIFISSDGKWHMQGMVKSPEKILKNVDVIFNALHDIYSEEGSVQDVLSHHSVPFTGSRGMAGAMASNKWMVKERVRAQGIKTPVYAVVRRSDDLSRKAQEIFNSIPHPLKVSPANGANSMGSFEVSSFTTLLAALENVLERYDMALVEEAVVGKSVSCLVTENFRGEKIYAFPPNNTLSSKEKEEIERLAKDVHKMLGLSDYSTSNFIVSPRRGVYFVEIEALPRLHKDSIVHKSLESVGVTMKEFLNHILNLTLKRA